LVIVIGAQDVPEIFLKFLIAVLQNGKVEIKTVSELPEKYLILFKWNERERV